MSDIDAAAHVAGFYDTHPISAAQILDKLRVLRGNLDDLKPEDLLAHDQDHYGGLAANDALADAAGIGADSLVLDLCSGLGGPARYQSVKRKCRVVGLDFNESRVRGAVDLTRRVGLAKRVRFVRGSAEALPFPAASFDAVLSQEALLHVRDKARALGEVQRVLKPGGSLAFTDWIAGPAMTEADRDLLWRGIAGQTIQSVNQYLDLLRKAGFAELRVVNLSAMWVPILRERLAMYEALREDAKQREGRDVHAEYCAFYASFVGLVESGALGGGRFAGHKPLTA